MSFSSNEGLHEGLHEGWDEGLGEGSDEGLDESLDEGGVSFLSSVPLEGSVCSRLLLLVDDTMILILS